MKSWISKGIIVLFVLCGCSHDPSYEKKIIASLEIRPLIPPPVTSPLLPEEQEEEKVCEEEQGGAEEVKVEEGKEGGTPSAEEAPATTQPAEATASMQPEKEQSPTEEEKELSEQKEEAPLEIREEVKFDIPIVVNDRVEYFIKYFQTAGREKFTKWLQRSGRYIPLMRKLLREHGLPEDLVYLAMIESGFNPHAYSRRRAAGPWQFIYHTGRKYGLVVNWWIDERRDPEKSTIAAARYLKDLYDQFQCWYLAAAGYNAGEGKISRAIRRYRTEDFWKLAKYRYLKRETRDYVPKLIAAALIAKNPEKYGFTNIEYEEPIEYEKVRVPDATDLRIIARCCGVDYETIKALNPELKRWCTPPNYPDYEVKIPKGTKERFLRNFARLKPSERITFRRHRVRRGETLARIARLYGTRVKPIMELNGIRNPRRVRAGTYLIIPLPASRSMAMKRAPSPRRTKPKRGPFKEIIYTVRKGDTLWEIAQQFNLNVREIKRWNNLRGNLIHPGDRLRLWIEEERG